MCVSGMLGTPSMRPFQTAASGEALDYIIKGLTQPQRRLLVSTLASAAWTQPRYRVSEGQFREDTIRALMGKPSPLVHEDEVFRYLSDLGVEVARRLNATGEWDLPLVDPVPHFSEGVA